MYYNTIYYIQIFFSYVCSMHTAHSTHLKKETMKFFFYLNLYCNKILNRSSNHIIITWTLMDLSETYIQNRMRKKYNKTKKSLSFLISDSMLNRMCFGFVYVSLHFIIILNEDKVYWQSNIECALHFEVCFVDFFFNKIRIINNKKKESERTIYLVRMAEWSIKK